MSGQWGESPARGDDAPGALTDGGAAGGAVPPPRTGGRAEARRAAQGRGGPGNGGPAKAGPHRGGTAAPATSPAGASPAGASPAGGRAAARASRKPKRNVKKIAAWSAAGALVLIAGTGGAIYWKLNGNIKSFGKDGVAAERPPEAAADANGNKPVNILLIGSDSRGKGNADLGGGEDGGARSDTTILLHVYADHKHAVGISFPRDTLVTLPKCKQANGQWTKEHVGKFNEAFSTGGSETGNPACTQNAVEKITGIFVNHTIVVDFQGFAAMTKAVDGVDICLPEDIYEKDLNQKLPKKGDVVLKRGPQKVQGQQALDYVRLRHGIGDGSDIGRMKRQQAFLSSLASKIKKQGLTPTNLLPLADAATKSLTVDEGLGSVDKLMSFGLSLKDIDMHDLKFVTAPWRIRTDEALELVKADADKLWATIKADRTIDGQNATGEQPAEATTPAVAPVAPTTPAAATTAADTANQSIKVGVYNGTVSRGMDGKAAELLKTAKFAATRMGAAMNTKYATTMIEYGTGQRANAEKVAELFPGASVAAGKTAGITVIVGKDFAAANGGTADATATAPGASAAPATPAEPAPLPTSVINDTRSADDNLCEGTTYGSGG
ncbi:LCP family protein [Kitasatospora sp. NPDC058406]|uniref:LCP family protein n=1 Tax=Kitasatospora sp. NPDC058406 TaxID=3346483 RepID=UPI0036567D06